MLGLNSLSNAGKYRALGHRSGDEVLRSRYRRLCLEVRPGVIFYFWLLADEAHDEEARKYLDSILKDHSGAMACPLPGSWQKVGEDRRHRVRVISADGQRRYTFDEVKFNCAHGDTGDDAAEMIVSPGCPISIVSACSMIRRRRMGFRAKVLEKQIKLRRSAIAREERSTSNSWDRPVDGAELLTELAATLKAYVVLPDHAEVAIALWASACSRLRCRSNLAVFNDQQPHQKVRQIHPACTSARACAQPDARIEFHRSVHLYGRQACNLADRRSREDRKGRRASQRLNGGYSRRQAFVVRKGVRYSIWSPKVIALIGRLPDTIMDRSVVIRMRRKLDASSEGLAALRAARTGKKANPETKAKISAASKERELNKRIRRLMDPYRWT